MYHNNILARLGKPLPYNDQFMDSTALRTGTYTVDHLKLTTIVGMSFINYFCKKLMNLFHLIYLNYKISLISLIYINYIYNCIRSRTIWISLAR